MPGLPPTPAGEASLAPTSSGRLSAPRWWPPGYENSTEHESQSTIRRIPQCIATGQAAGVAAALSLRAGVTPRQVDVPAVQAELLRQGAYLGPEREVVSEESAPLPEMGGRG